MISGLKEKLGFWSNELIKKWLSHKDWIWIHAVSVGEFNLVYPLVLEINKSYPNYPIMISCITKAGYNLAKAKSIDKNFLVFYFPLDIPYIINSLLNYAKVKLLIIAETEIWPFTLITCSKKNIPIILVNARLSDKSFKNYYLFKFLFKYIINLFTTVLAQSENDAKKFSKLGLKNEKIHILGNLKFAPVKYNGSSKNNSKLVLNDKNTIKILFASTHKGEDEIAISVFKELINDFKNIRLIIAPRHIERTGEISMLIKSYGLTPKLRTKNEIINSIDDIFLIDTIGELTRFYKISKITVLCGTFVNIGGHNILEPIRAGSYTLIGPYDFKIKELSSIFKSRNAIIQVSNKYELKDKIKEAIENTKLTEKIVENGKKILAENEGILSRTTDEIFTLLRKG